MIDNCIFCKIVDGTAPGTFVYRDDNVAAFMDIQPVNPGHILVVPITHAGDLAELDPSNAASMMVIAHEIASAIRASGIKCEGVNLFLADGEAAGQEVFHVHLHVFPRFRGDGFGFRFGPNYTQRPDRSELEEAANLVRSNLTQHLVHRDPKVFRHFLGGDP